MKYLVAIPCMDMIHTGFFRSCMGLNRVGETRFSLTMSSLIYDARNSLARQAINEGFDRMLWLDSDMEFETDLMERLAADMDEGRDFVAGIYFKRKAPVSPVVYSEIGHMEVENGGIRPYALPYEDYPKDQIFTCKGVGFGGCMLSVNMLKAVVDKYGLPFSPILGFGEDLSFCARARELGFELYCDSRVKLGHIGYGAITEELYLAQHGETKKDGDS